MSVDQLMYKELNHEAQMNFGFATEFSHFAPSVAIPEFNSAWLLNISIIAEIGLPFA